MGYIKSHGQHVHSLYAYTLNRSALSPTHALQRKLQLPRGTAVVVELWLIYIAVRRYRKTGSPNRQRIVHRNESRPISVRHHQSANTRGRSRAAASNSPGLSGFKLRETTDENVNAALENVMHELCQTIKFVVRRKQQYIHTCSYVMIDLTVIIEAMSVISLISAYH